MVTLIARASLTVCLILAFAGSIHAGDAETIDIFRAGQEADVLALLGPYDEASFEIRGWSLDGVSVGPGCEILFKMVHRGAEERVEVFVVPRASGGPGSFAYRWDGAAGHDAQIAQLRSGFEALVDGNDPGDFFTTRCLTVVTDGEESGLIGALSELLTVDVGAVSPNGAESPAAPPLVEVQEVRPAGKGAIPWLRFLLAISGAIFALWLLRGVRPSRGIRGASTLWQRAPLILLVILALTVRWMVMRGTPLAEYELDNFYVIGLNDLLVFMGLGTQTSLVWQSWGFHTPLLLTALTGWFDLGEALGVGDLLFWVRLPNLVFSALLMLLLVRIGRNVGVPSVGWWAAALFAFSPILIQLSSRQGHYFLEMVTCTWFLERLTAYLVAESPVHRTLALSAAVSVWTGYMAALVLLPGGLTYILVTWRRGEGRRGFAAGLLALALVAPILPAMIETSLFYLELSAAAAPEPLRQAWLHVYTDHGHLQISPPSVGGFFEFFLDAMVTLHGPAGWVALGLLGVLAIVRPFWGGYILLQFGLFAGVSLLLAIRWVNLTSLVPFLLVGPLWGAGYLAGLLRRAGSRSLLCGGLWVVLLISSFADLEERQSQAHTRYLVDWVVRGPTYRSVTRQVLASPGRGRPVVLFSGSTSDVFTICQWEETAEDILACMAASGDRTAGEPITVFEFRGWTVALPSEEFLAFTEPGSCLTWDLLERPPWTRQDFLLFDIWQSREANRAIGCPRWRAPARCEIQAEATGVTLWRCPPVPD